MWNKKNPLLVLCGDRKIPRVGTGRNEIALSHLGKNNGNPDLACKKKRIHHLFDDPLLGITFCHHLISPVMSKGDP